MSQPCEKHKRSPAFIYDECVGCEIETMRSALNRYRKALELLRDSHGRMHDDQWILSVTLEALNP